MENNIVSTFNRIYETLYPAVRAYFSRRFHPDEAEDLTQITFMKLWAYLPCAQLVKNEKALVFKIAKNVCTDRLRQKDMQVLFEELNEQLASKEQTNFESDIELQMTLNTLSAQDRELVDLCRHGWNSKEIAKIQGISASAVRTRKQVLRKRLKNLLDI